MRSSRWIWFWIVLLNGASAWAQGSPLANAKPTPTNEAQTIADRIEALEPNLAGCPDGCELLRGLVGDLRDFKQELEESKQDELALEREKSDAEKERQSVESEPGELSAEEVQHLSPTEIEVLDQEVRLTSLDQDARKEAIEKELLELTNLRRRQTDFAGRLVSIAEASYKTPQEKAWLEERKAVLRKARDLMGARINANLESLELARQRLSVTELLLERRSGRLSSVRLFEGIPADELARSKERVAQLRQAILQRSSQFEGQMAQLDQSLGEVAQKLQDAERQQAALEQQKPIEPGAALEEWKRQSAVATEVLEELRSQQSALGSARGLIQESIRLDEFLLALQESRLEQDQEFNRLLGLIRNSHSEVGAIELGLAGMRERLDGVIAEAQAMQITSDKLRSEIQIVTEQIKHSALRLDAANEEASQAPDNSEALVAEHVSRLEAILSHQQAISESLNGRRSLIEEAIVAANEQIKKLQDAIHLLESYVGGSLRFQWGTLLQALDWVRGELGPLRAKLDQLPGYWLELRLSLERPEQRDRILGAGAFILGVSAVLLCLDFLLGRILRRRWASLDKKDSPFSKDSWLITGFPAQPSLKEELSSADRQLGPRILLYATDRLRRPLEWVVWCAMGSVGAPEPRPVWIVLGLLFLAWFTRRSGILLVEILASPEPRIPSFRLWPNSAGFLLIWSRWLFGLLPLAGAAYGAAQSFDAPLPIRLTLSLLVFALGLLFLLILLIWGQTPVIRMIQLQSAREKPSLPLLVYNRLVGQVYLAALLTVLGSIGLAGAGYGETARWLAIGFASSLGIFVGLAVLVRGVHLWLRRVQARDSIWGDFLGFLVHLLEALFVAGAMIGVLMVWGVDLRALGEFLRRELEREVFQTADGVSVKVVTLAWVLGLLLATSWISRRSRELLQNRVYPYLSIDRGQQLSMNLVVHYGMLVVAGLIGLNMLGVNLTTLRVVLGAIGLGVGFGLQTIVNNFISGLIILFERSVRPDDVIDFGGTRVRVEEIRARCTIVTDEDNKPWIVPNVRLVSETITNWSRNWNSVRYITPLFMSPRTDVSRLRDVCNAFLEQHPDVLPNPAPELRLIEIQPGALRFSIYFCTPNAWPVSKTRSRILIELIELLQKQGFELAMTESRVYYKPEAQ